MFALETLIMYNLSLLDKSRNTIHAKTNISNDTKKNNGKFGKKWCLNIKTKKLKNDNYKRELNKQKTKWNYV